MERGATRRNTRFLYSVQEDQLDGHGYAVTLTLKSCPPSSKDWHRIRRAWEMRMVRAGMIRLHWVTEWQRRGVPHLHCAIWFPETTPPVQAMDSIVRAWLLLGEPYGVGSVVSMWRGLQARSAGSSTWRSTPPAG